MINLLSLSLNQAYFLYIKMETGSVVFILFLIFIFCFIIYDSIPSKYTKLEESFGGFMNRSLVRFDYEKIKSHHYILLFMVGLVQGKQILLDNT